MTAAAGIDAAALHAGPKTTWLALQVVELPALPHEPWHISLSQLEICKSAVGRPLTLGQGGFGTVSPCTATCLQLHPVPCLAQLVRHPLSLQLVMPSADTLPSF